MNRSLLIVLIALLSQNALACDLCNCYLTITPNDHKNTVGFRYRFSQYETSGDHTMAKIMHGGMSSTEKYSTYELWGRFYPVPKIQVELAIPYRYNRSIEDGGGSDRIQGLGDLILLTYYEVLSTFPKGPEAVKHRLYLGGGIKLPTGRSDKSLNGEIDPHMQAGSGSLDFMLSGLYLAKFKNIGAKAAATYSFNNENKNRFTFANRLNLSGSLFYQVNIGPAVWMPSGGLYFEQAKEDLQDGIAQANTGGRMLLGSIGSDVYFKSYALNISFQRPLTQSVGEDQPKNSGRFVIGLSYSLKTKNEML